MQLASARWLPRQVTAVDTANSQVIAGQHGLKTGQIVRVTADKSDPGMMGNPLCKPRGLLPNVPSNDCDFWVKAVDGNTIEFYNDAALTSKVILAGGAVNMALNTSEVTVAAKGRGALKTTAAPHKAGATMSRGPAVLSTNVTGNPTGSHAYLHVAGAATAVDADVSTTDEGNGQTITGRGAFDMLDQMVPLQERSGANVPNCKAAGLDVDRCDNPQWGIRPRPLIRAVTVAAAADSVHLTYTAPDANACRIGISGTPFASSDSAGDKPDSAGSSAREFNQGGLAANTSYFYRITCGPDGGSARVTGNFRTGAPAAASGTTYQGDPTNYKTLLPLLRAGDTLVLGPGVYPLLNIDGLNGAPSAWITITGPDSGPPAIIAASSTCCNTVEIANSSYLAIKNLTIDSKGILQHIRHQRARNQQHHS